MRRHRYRTHVPSLQLDGAFQWARKGPLCHAPILSVGKAAAEMGQRPMTDAQSLESDGRGKFRQSLPGAPVYHQRQINVLRICIESLLAITCAHGGRPASKVIKRRCPEVAT